jgi:hypothetical protein
MATWQKRGVYHSALREKGPIRMAFTSEVKQSKYAGKPPFVYFKVAGDDTEYQYTVENPTVEQQINDALSAFGKDTYIMVEAAGTKDTAVLHTSAAEDDGSPASVPQQAPQSAQDAHGGSQAPTQQGGQPQKSLARNLWECLQAAKDVADAFQQKYGREMTENERTIAISLYIERNRGNGRIPLAG